ncbi:MAG: hypothetical protein RI911_905 [Candidatus Parcubacteria bacterium]|jgi:predicted alpha/beta hydrolase family esterase
MAQQLIFVHGGEAFPTHGMFLDWLRTIAVFDPLRQDRRQKRWHRQLEAVLPGWSILRPQMPNDTNAQYVEWELYFEKVVPYMEQGCVLVGHSLGGTFLLKYLTKHVLPVQPKALHLVAPSFGVPGTSFEVDEDVSVIPTRIPTTIHHSHDDTVVPYSESVEGILRMPGAQLISYETKGHFIDETFPELVSLLCK